MKTIVARNMVLALRTAARALAWNVVTAALALFAALHYWPPHP